MNRPVIFADEPTGNLDADNAAKVAALLASESTKRLIVVATHDAALFGRYADRVITLSHGRIIGDDNLRECSGSAEASSARPCLTFAAATRLAFLSAKKSARRLAVTGFALLLAMLTCCISLNVILVDPVEALYAAAKSDNALFYEVAKYGEYHDQVESAHYYSYNNIGDNFYYYDNLPSQADTSKIMGAYDAIVYKNINYGVRVSTGGGASSPIRRVYFSDKCTAEIVAGKPVIADGAIAIPEDLAITLFATAQAAVGKTVYAGIAPVTVCAVFRDGSSRAALDKQNSTAHGPVFRSAFMTENTYRKIIAALLLADDSGLPNVSAMQCLAAVGGEGSACGVRPRSYLEKTELPLAHGVVGTREDGICLSYDLAEKIATDAADAVGREVTVRFYNHYNSLSVTRTYAVEGVFAKNAAPDNFFALSDGEYAAIAPDFVHLYNQGHDVRGFAIKDYTLEAVKDLHDMGYCADAYFCHPVSATMTEVYRIGLFMCLAAAALLIVALIIAALFAGDMVGKMAVTMGVLRSYGVGKRGLAKMLALQPLTIIALCAALTLGLHPLAVTGLKMLLAVFLGFDVAFIPLYYAALSALAVIALVAAFLALSVLSVYFGLNRKSAKDIIYGS